MQPKPSTNDHRPRETGSGGERHHCAAARNPICGRRPMAAHEQSQRRHPARIQTLVRQGDEIMVTSKIFWVSARLLRGLCFLSPAVPSVRTPNTLRNQDQEWQSVFHKPSSWRLTPRSFRNAVGVLFKGVKPSCCLVRQDKKN
jgi:hypothetical protein